MRNVIGIRKETKDKTQRRAPLSPKDVRWLVREKNIRVLVEPWPQRIFKDEEYTQAGAELTSDLSNANIIFGVKEVAPSRMLPDKAYVFFSHVVKGQAYNMQMLRHILASNVSLFDYELVKDMSGKRSIAFGDFAGYAGLIDSLWALGERLSWEGVTNVFSRMKYATAYEKLEEARADLRAIGRDIRSHGLPKECSPFVVLLTGYGRVSTAALELLKLLPTKMINPGSLQAFIDRGAFSRNTVYIVQCRKPDMYTKTSDYGTFDLDEFTAHPERYSSKFLEYVPHASLIINGIYWESKYPRMLTKEYIKKLFGRGKNPTLRVIGDITCDIGGSVEITVKSTTDKDPVYVYSPSTDTAISGWKGRGPVVLAVDILPTELPWEASSAFSTALAPFVPGLARADLSKPVSDLAIGRAFKDALIAHRGSLTPPFSYLTSALDK
jgi:alpha-aminoadipic semialdehyde synthase